MCDLRLIFWGTESGSQKVQRESEKLYFHTSVIRKLRGDSSRAGAIAASTDFWSDLDGSSANRLRHLRAERCANWPPLLLTPFPPYRAFERTMGLIPPYPTPVATGSRLYKRPELGGAAAARGGYHVRYGNGRLPVQQYYAVLATPTLYSTIEPV